MNGLVNDAISKVCVYATKGELLPCIVACLLEGVMVESPNVTVIVSDSNTLLSGIFLKGVFGDKGLCR